MKMNTMLSWLDVNACIITLCIKMHLMHSLSTAGSDYTSLDSFVDLPNSDGLLRSCFNIEIADDQETEPVETLVVQLHRDVDFTTNNLILRPNATTIIIQDNDGRQLLL